MLCLSDIIRDHEPSLQPLLCAVEEAPTLTALLVAVWPLARVLALHVVEYVLAERARRPTAWPPCPVCGACLRSKGLVKRQVTSLFGPLQWRRRVGRCPQGCHIPSVVPLDAELEVPPSQRTSGELQALGCALAVFVPFATAATLLGWYSGRLVSPQAVWGWVQVAGQRAMATLQEQVDALATGALPPEEFLAAEHAVLPLLLGADGVMVPVRPEEGTPKGKTRWREVKVGVLARLGQHRTRAGQVVTRLHQRRLVAVLGDIEALTSRLWLEAVRQGITSAPGWSGSAMARGGYGACLMSALRPMRRGSWTSITPRNTCGRGQRPGWMDGPPRLAAGSRGPATACGMAIPTGSWPTSLRPWTWKVCPPRRGPR